MPSTEHRCKLTIKPEDINNCLWIFDTKPTDLDVSKDKQYTDSINFIKNGKSPSAITEASGAYNYRKNIDQICIKIYQGEGIMFLNGSIKCT